MARGPPNAPHGRQGALGEQHRRSVSGGGGEGRGERVPPEHLSLTIQVRRSGAAARRPDRRIQGKDGALAVTTQVAEMSLDISADLLVTDLAPVPALIQRLGRLNRRARAGDATRPVLRRSLPDSRTDLTPARNSIRPSGGWMSLVAAPFAGASGRSVERDAGGGIGPSRVRLARRRLPHRADARARTHAVDHGPDGGRRCRPCRSRQRDPGEVALPMLPRRSIDMGTFQRVYGLPVVPRGLIDYDPLRGARWHAQQEPD